MISTTLLDLNWTGRPRSIGAALLRSGPIKALIDPGPASTITTLKEKLAVYGLNVADLDYVFLTHIHLDHAGASGSLVKENPKLKIFVHSRGAAHMADPAILLHSAERLYADKMVSLFGECLPVPESNLQVMEGGETLPLGDTTLAVAYTPGHASHHVTYFEPIEGTAFVGDTAGICVESHPLVLPATPPPDINMELWMKSLDTIEMLKPKQLFLTHFGFSNSPTRHLAEYRTRLRLWSEIASTVLKAGLDDRAAMQEFSRQVTLEAEPYVAQEEAEHYRYNGQLPLSWMGLARYHRKRAGVPSS